MLRLVRAVKDCSRPSVVLQCASAQRPIALVRKQRREAIIGNRPALPKCGSGNGDRNRCLRNKNIKGLAQGSSDGDPSRNDNPRLVATSLRTSCHLRIELMVLFGVTTL